jgi:2-polyprenyl-3-methyl-5-hydroxy-6-metoxy-1,4-benzoquinol methylase
MTQTLRRAQYELERTLRRRILDSPPQQRAQVVSQAYQELFRAFPDHSAFQETPQSRRAFGQRQAGMIAPLVRPGQQVLEVGCGRGDTLAALATLGCVCTGTEPSQEMIDLCRQYDGIDFRLGTAERLEFPGQSFDLVFSMQVLEHLHPDDVPLHFAEALRVLRPGGIVAVETPNLRTGPQDISRGFSPTADGLHLKEWTVAGLAQVIRAAGFVRISGLLAPPAVARRNRWLHRLSRTPSLVKRAEDALLAAVPAGRMRTIAGKLLGLDDIFLFGTNP